MTLTQITVFFLEILIVIVIAMLAHSYLDKKKIKKKLLDLVDPLKGSVSQESVFHYPRFHCEFNGRAFDLFFDVVKAGRQHILYSIYSLTASVPHPFLLVKKDEFRPIADPERFLKENGPLLADIDPPFQGYSKTPNRAKKTYLTGDTKKFISALNEFTSLQLGPDALIAGKPYEGLSDADSEKIMQAILSLEKLAQEIEACPA